MDMLLCGLGAVGAMFAERLAPLGLRVVADPGRVARYRADGVMVNARRLDVAYVTPADGAPVELILIAVKRAQLDAAIAELRPFVGPRTLILSLLNGVDSEAVIGAALGHDRVLPAFVVETDAVRDADGVRYTRLGTIVFGEPRASAPTPRVEAVRAVFDAAGIPCRVAPDMPRELWWKFMLNVGVNQLSALLRVGYGAFADPGLQDLVRAACAEVVAVARAEGVGLGSADIEAIFPILARLAPGQRTSMLQDVEAGRVTENAMLGGMVVELGRRHGIPTPVNAMLARLLGVLDASAAAQPG